MDINNVLRQKIGTYAKLTQSGYAEEVVTISQCKMCQVRDAILKYGDILEEELDNNIYVGSLKSGFGKMNRTILAVHVGKNQINIAAFAREGLINQHTANKAIRTIIGEL